MSVVISSFFTRFGSPQTGLTPRVRIWEVTGTTQTLLVGAPDGTKQNTDAPMLEVTGTVSDGFYQYEFTAVNGFDPNKTFLVRADGGATLPVGERYQITGLNPADTTPPVDVASLVWDDLAASHNSPGTMGAVLNTINSTTHATAIDVLTVQTMLDLLLKYETNRTKIDPVAKTLTIYDDNCSTPLRVFQLLDSTGAPSITSVTERKPISATDGQPICP